MKINWERVRDLKEGYYIRVMPEGKFYKIERRDDIFVDVTETGVGAGATVTHVGNELNPPENQIYYLHHVAILSSNTKLKVKQPGNVMRWSTNTAEGYIDDTMATVSEPAPIEIFVTNNKQPILELTNTGSAAADLKVKFIGYKLLVIPVEEEPETYTTITAAGFE